MARQTRSQPQPTQPAEPAEPTQPADSDQAGEPPNRAARRARRKGKQLDGGSALPDLEPRGRVHDQVMNHRQFVVSRRGNR